MKYPINKIVGVIPAMITCFDEDGNFDEHRQRNLTRFLVSQRVGGLYLTGSTGESFLMTPDERKQVVEVVADELNGAIPFIVHVGAIGTKVGIELAKHAEDHGADAISSVPPFYYHFKTDEIYGYYSDIAEKVEIPMIVYNIALAGLMSNSLIYRLSTIEKVKGLKFTGTQHYDMATLKEDLGKDFMIYSGCDEMATQGLLAGADGLIGSFYNLMPSIFNTIFQLSQEERYSDAFSLQKAATEFILKAVQYGHFGVIKQCLTEIGIDAGFVRKPFLHPDSNMMTDVWSCVKKLEEGNEDIKVQLLG